MKRWEDESNIKYGLIVGILFVAALYGAIVYVAVHFISKFW